jgi:hypothetical protein
VVDYQTIAEDARDGLAICGVHCPGDAIHVGIFWHSEGEKRIIHFQNGTNIPVEDLENPQFNHFFFNPIRDFPLDVLPSLAALSELISDNDENAFVFNREPVIYNGGKFHFPTGNYEAQSPVEKIVNCAVFVLALLNTYDYQLLDWNSWPNISEDNNAFLNSWLDHYNIPHDQRSAYYQMTKEVRGKHVIVCPDTRSSPSPYNEASVLADELIHRLNNPI